MQEESCPVIAAASPDKEYYKDFVKTANTFYMPTWNESELQLFAEKVPGFLRKFSFDEVCQSSICQFALLTRLQIISRFKRHGGVLRSLFHKSPDEAQDKIQQAISTLSLNPNLLSGLMSASLYLPTTPEISHKIASFVVDTETFRSNQQIWLSSEIAANVFVAVRARDLHNARLVLHMILQLGGAGRALLGNMYQPVIKYVLERDGGQFDCYKIKEMGGGKDLKYVVDADNKTKMTFKPLSKAIKCVEDAFDKIVEQNESPEIKVR